MGKYDDIINLPHHVSKKHPHMSMIDRAAQFSPFKALVGLDGENRETARLTDARIELDENEKEILNEKLLLIAENLHERPYAAITYFKPDTKKEGGEYVTAEGSVKKINEYERTVTMTDGTVIQIEEITEINSDESEI